MKYLYIRRYYIPSYLYSYTLSDSLKSITTIITVYISK